MANTYLTRTQSAGNRRTFTISVWVKRSTPSARQSIISASIDGNNETYIWLNSTDKLSIRESHGNTSDFVLQTNRLFRDVNAWYHIVLAVDTTQATASDRVKVYVNGVQETSFESGQETYPSQNYETRYNNNSQVVEIGRHLSGYPFPFDGVMSHFHFVDGTAYAPTVFGSTDSTTGEWKINTNPNVTYGTNGFFILKDGNSVTDQSPNTNNFTVAGGTLTKTEDCPSNVFATWNPLFYAGGAVTHSAGNTRFAESGNYWKSTLATIGASTGKYYAEFKCNGNWMIAGVVDLNDTLGYGIVDRNFFSTTHISNQGYGLYNADGSLRYRGSETTYGSSYGSGDILQIALDCDNNRVFFGINGTWQNSADPTNSGTGFAMNATNPIYTFACSVQNDEVHANFGGGFFATTEITTNTGTGFQDADGKGRFFYNPPTNFRCLSTKGLNQ